MAQEAGGTAAAPALALLRARRQLLAERTALAAHDVLAPEGVAFSRVREACELALERVEAAVAEGRSEPSPALERLVGGALAKGVSFAALAGALHAALEALLRQTADAAAEAVPVVVAASALVRGLTETAAAGVDAAQRTALRRRAAVLERLRSAAGTLAGGSRDPEQAPTELARAAADALRCDWAAVALGEADGRLVLAGAVGRAAGWMQRWSLRVDEGLAAQALAEPGAALAPDPQLLPFEGDDRPRAALVVALRARPGERPALLLAGRDSEEAFAADDVALADGLADVASLALGAAGASAASARLSAQLGALRHAAEAAVRGDESAALGALARAAARLAQADVALLRLVDEERRQLVTRAVHAASPALAAELAGTTGPVEERLAAALLRGEEVAFDGTALSATARRLPSPTLTGVALPVALGGQPAGGLELVRLRREPFSEDDLEHGRAAAAQVELVLALGARPQRAGAAAAALDGLAEALAAGGDLVAVARVLARHAAEAAGARGALVWVRDAGGGDALELVATHGVRADELGEAPGGALAREALRRDEAVLAGGPAPEVAALAGRGASPVALALPLRGRADPVGVVLLLFAERRPAVAASSSAPLAVLGAAGADAIGRALEATALRDRLARVAALYDAAAPLGPLRADDLLATALRLAGADRAVLYAHAGGELAVRASLGGAEPAAPLVRAILDEGGGPVTVPGVIVRDDLAGDARLATRAQGAGAAAAVVVPLEQGGDEVGALALLYRTAPVPRDAVEAARRLAGPLAAVLGATERGRVLRGVGAQAADAERTAHEAVRRLAAYDEVADALLRGDGVEQRLAAAAARVAGGAAAAVQLAGRPTLRPAALHTEASAPAEPVRRVLGVGLAADAPGVRAALAGQVVVLAADARDESPLAPFLRAGSSAVLVPLGPPGAVRGVVVVIALDPARPLDAAAAQAVRRLTVL